ncbi:TlpA family protein disulfide reductase [Anditalea andensis]|uniref:Thioredoxin domain-containing protein n=1 Tax=Anditalea andensis TaxID=1048983 RepID=A0A074KYJ9_9BACT|nr:TlpA disulfide reductase family protein [Anditalea andensis]KEO73300.1 hypothetical protein EL17_13200 [Anditalea andensis]
MKNIFILAILICCMISEQALSQSVPKDLEEKIASMTTVENGKTVPLGYFINNIGEKYSFGDFQGKLIVVDFWASWCGPCIQQTPYFEALSKRFAEDEVVFLKISIDEQQSFWQKYISDRNWVKGSYWMGTDEQNPIYPFVYTEYEEKNFKGIVTAVPRYVIISKDGTILNNQAIHPSHPRLQREIKNYLKN